MELKETWLSESDSLSSHQDPPHNPLLGATLSESGDGLHLDRRPDPGLQQGAPAPVTLGRYELRGLLGRGGMGVVYRARDNELDRDVALKVLIAGTHAGEKRRKRFMREARAVAQLRHPNIVQIHDIGVHEDNAFFTMELIEGPSLAKRARSSRLGARDGAAIVAILARALACAHERGLVHRDVKPGNVLLDDAGSDDSSPERVTDLGRPVLTDFGLVKNIDPGDDTAALTRGGAVVGTPAYMAPEQIRGDIDAIGPHSDQYALGVMLWELASGTRPHASATPAESVQRALLREPLVLRDRSVPTPLRQICEKTLADAPRERYPDCLALGEDLDRFLAGEPVLAASPGPLWYARRFVRRYRRALAIVCLIALGAAGAAWALGAIADWRATRAERARQSAAEQRRIAMQTRIDALTVGSGVRDRQAMAAADRAFDGFTQLEENAETRALARAWLDRAALLKQRAQSASDEHAVAARAAYATAYGLSESRAEQVPALLGLATMFRAAYNWSATREAIATLTRRAPEAATHPVALAVRRDLALIDRRLADAAALVRSSDSPDRSDAPEMRLLARLARATRTPHRARVAARWDIDRDGRPELALAHEESNHVTVVGLDDAALPVRSQLAIPGDPGPIHQLRPLSRPATEPPVLLVMEEQNRAKIVRLTDGQLELATVPPPGYFYAVESGDLNGDGAVEHYAAQMVRIVSLAPREDGGFAVKDALPLGSVGSAYVRDLAIADLDRDGRTELIAATESWGGYDIRTYRAAERGLELAARHRLGKVVQVEIIRAPGELRAAVIQEHDAALPLNRRVFADDVPHGAHRGIHVLALTADGWQPRTSVPLESLLSRPRGRSPSQVRWTWPTLLSGDLDGDGLDDLVASYQNTWMVVYHQRPDGAFTELMIDGTVPLAIHDIDRDGAAELIVHIADAVGDVWVLGLGGDRLPPIEPDEVERTATATTAAVAQLVWSGVDTSVERDIESALRADWHRAEDLAAMGLHALAARRFEEIASLTAGTPTEARALYRAGAALETSARELPLRRLSERAPLAEASALYRRAADAAHTTDSSKRPLQAIGVRAWDAALRCDLAARRHESALEAARTRSSLPQPPPDLAETIRRLEAALAATPIAFDFTTELDRRWRVHRPFDVRVHRHERGLRTRAVGDAPLLSLPLRRTAGPIRMTLEASAERTDWAGVFFVALVPGHELAQNHLPLVSLDSKSVFRWQTMGGAQVFHERIICGWMRPHDLDRAEAPARRNRRLVWEYSTEEDRESCELELGEQVLRGRRDFGSGWDVPEEVTLVIGGGGLDGMIATAEVLLRRLELVGFEIAPVELDRLSRAHYNLAVGRPDLALATLDADTPSTPPSVAAEVARATALAELAYEPEANRVLSAALARDLDLGGLLLPIMRHHLDSFESAVRTALGTRYYRKFSAVYNSTVTQHHDDPRGIAPLLTYLRGLGATPFEALLASPADASAHLTLLAHRGAAWRKRYRSVLGYRDLTRAQELGQYLLASPGYATFSASIRRDLAHLGRDLAPIHVERGEHDQAIATLLQSIAISPAPEVLADRIAIDDELAPLRAHPRWPDVWRARHIGEWPGTLPDAKPGHRSESAAEQP